MPILSVTESAAEMLILNIFDLRPSRFEIKIESNPFVTELKYVRISWFLLNNLILIETWKVIRG